MKSKLIGVFLLFIIFLLTVDAEAQQINSIGVPYVQNYSKAIYKAGNQNWSVARDENGIMYFGNSEGLLVFDGKYWKRHILPNRLIVRSVASDNKGKIYTGAFGEFGYWQYDKRGNFAYTSLSSKLLGKRMPKDEIWKIYVDKDRVIFQSFASIFIYKEGKITEIKSENHFLFLFKARDRFLVEVFGKGLYELKNNKLQLIANSESLGAMEVLSILPYKSNSYLIGTAKNGLFIYDGNSITKWENKANDFLTAYQLNNGSVILGKYYAFGTILNGVIIINEQGDIIQKINKSSGLQNNTVLSLYTDTQENLWVGLDNGIDRVELNSPLYFYFDKTGSFGTVYSSIVHKNKIYLGTNQGIFYSEWAGKGEKRFQLFDFKLINNSQGQVWDLALIDDQLICGHNSGTYRIINNSIEKITNANGGWTIKKLESHPEILIQGTYTGLVLYKKDQEGKWQFLNKIDGFGEPSRYVEQDEKGQIWVSHAYKGIYKLKLNKELNKVIESKNYDESAGLPTTYNVNIFKLENRLLFSSDSGFHIYDDISDKFFKYNQLNSLLGSYATSNKIIKASENKYWFINHGKVALVDFFQPGKLQIDSTQFTALGGRMVQYYENISQITSSIYLISVDDGFAIFNDYNKNGHSRPLPAVQFRSVENTTDRITPITENGKPAYSIEIPYKDNNLRISFSLPYYRQAQVEYQYFLDGYSNQWSEWSTTTEKEFTNLDYGKYDFKVRAKVNQKEVSQISSFKFTILPPWNATPFAKFGYVVAGILLLLLLRHLYILNLTKHQQVIKQKLQKEEEELRRQEAFDNEQKIIKLKNEQLEKDLSGKSRELANSALNIVYKNELLQKIRQGLQELKDSQGKKLSEEQLKKINKVIDEGMSDERDWNLFERSFNEAHENFFKKLKAKHPQLVPNDLKLCAYLRMNMSSKELASLLSISVRGVEIIRYRLRKKLDLEHDKNLVEFLMEL